jgi:hypothetical protein
MANARPTQPGSNGEPAHSPTPWTVDGLLIRDANGSIVASVATHEPVTFEQLRANAAFLVACVNAAAAKVGVRRDGRSADAKWTRRKDG